MELKYIEQLIALPDTILTEPISSAIKHQDLDILHIDVDESSIADFSKYDYEVVCVLISALKDCIRISIQLTKYAPKDIVACIEEEMEWN